MRRPALVSFFLLLILAAAHPGLGDAVSRRLTPLQKVTLKGELGARFNAAAANLLNRQDRYSIESYVSNASGVPGAALWPDWPGDQLGRMFSVMHVVESCGWTPARTLRRRVGDAVLPCQTKDGNFGPEKPLDQKDARIISGNAFALRGLLDAYQDSGEARYLEAARRLARYDETVFETWKDNGKGLLHEYYGHCLDGLVKLFELGGDRWALDLAARAAERVGRTTHTHHSLSMIRGVIDLYRATGDRRWLGKAEDFLAFCRDNRIVTGGLPEELPKSEQDEGCALSDFVIVNLMMFQATGEDRYIEDAERTLVNHLFMNQFSTGGFGHRGFAPDIVGGKRWQGWEGRFGSENPGCCSLWGAWALGQIGGFIVTRDAEAVEVNLYPSAGVDLPDRSARLEIESDFPRMSRVALTIHSDKAFKNSLRLRVPAWSDGAVLANAKDRARLVVSLNGKAAAFPVRAGRLVVDREWKSGDRLDISFAGSPRLVPWPKAGPGMTAVFDGPLCLSLSSAEADVDAFSRILVTAQGKPLLSAAGEPQAVDAKGARISRFHPIAEDWLSPNVKNPNRLRVLFSEQRN